MTKSNEDYFDTTPIPAKSVNADIGPIIPLPPTPVRPKRTMLPVVAFGAVLMILASIVFALGFYLGHEVAAADELRLTQPFSVNAPGYVEPQPPVGIAKPVPMPEELP